MHKVHTYSRKLVPCYLNLPPLSQHFQICLMYTCTIQKWTFERKSNAKTKHYAKFPMTNGKRVITLNINCVTMEIKLSPNNLSKALTKHKNA